MFKVRFISLYLVRKTLEHESTKATNMKKRRNETPSAFEIDMRS